MQIPSSRSQYLFIYNRRGCQAAASSEFYYAGTVSFPKPSFRKTIDPINPATVPPTAAMAKASTTFIGSLNAKGASTPGIGDAVPGALLIIPSAAAAIPEIAPPKKISRPQNCCMDTIIMTRLAHCFLYP